MRPAAPSRLRAASTGPDLSTLSLLPDGRVLIAGGSMSTGLGTELAPEEVKASGALQIHLGVGNTWTPQFARQTQVSGEQEEVADT